jgi:peptide-methionine (S)-S-oxide reductase
MLYKDQSQKEVFALAIAHAQTIWDNPIVTELKQLDTFYIAEDEHQGYFAKNPESGYCQIVIEPKISKTRKEFVSWLKDST